MTTRKLNNFEYAGLSQQGRPEFEGMCRQDGFDTPNGYAFVLVSSGVHNAHQAKLTEVALERIRYYLENETEPDINVAAANALSYTSGFIYQMVKKDASVIPANLSCICGLYKDGDLALAWIGDVCGQLFTGKKLFPLTWFPEKAEISGQSSWYLGLEPMINPEVTSGRIRPVNGDVLLLSSHEVCLSFQEKATRRIIQDSMPLQTKVARITRMVCEKASGSLAALVMVGFYNLDTEKRAFIAGKPYQRELPMEASDETNVQTETIDMAKKPGLNKGKKDTSLLWRIFYVLALLAVVYMVYDLLIHDPRPPVRIPSVETPVMQEMIEAPLPEEQKPDPVIPDDVAYTVRSGDTWSRIYAQFGVCSWFIINHPPNTGRFGRDGTLISGQQLMIPVIYSGRRDMNPDYYLEFSIDRVGSACQNAGRELLQSFQEMISQ